MFKLKSCVWEITLACSFSCKYCGSSGGRARDNELSTEECLRVVGELKDLGCKRVSMIGGEVFMRKDWKTIVKALTDRDIKVNIITNGFGFVEESIADLKEVNIESVAVSLDGPREIHDKYRQPGSFDRAVLAIKALTDSNILTSVISTLNSENVKYLEELYSELLKYPISAWQLQACSPMGNAALLGVKYKIDAGEVLDFVNSHIYGAPFALGVAHNIGYYAKENGHQRGNLTNKVFFNGCTAGLSTIGIDSVGNVRGCESMYADEFIEGNLRNRSLRDIWECEDSFAYNRKFDVQLLTGKCSQCELGEFCAGGCRSYNYFTHNKLYESSICINR